MLRKTLLTATLIVTAMALPTVQREIPAFELFPVPNDQYTVQRGDTLYGLAGYFYSNPALWPFLSNQNPQIKTKGSSGAPDKEPLQPGTKVNLYHKRTSATIVNEEYQPPTGLPEDLRFMVTKVPAQGLPYDKKYFRYRLSSRPLQVWGYIVSSPEPHKVHYLERDLVYIRFRPSKKQAILVGDRLGIYREKGPVNHPLNPDRPIGIVTETVGEVEIISTGHELATAIILDSYVEIVRGDKICLFTPRSREIVPSKTHRMLTGTVLYSASRHTFYTDSNNLENDVLFVDRGECDGMTEGMLVNIYRPTTAVQDPYNMRMIAMPDTYVGEGMILKAFEKNSTLLVTRQKEEILPGDVIKSVSD